MANTKPIIKDSTINRIRAIINNDGGVKLELVDLMKNQVYLTIHRNHMNSFERRHSTKILSYIYDDMDNETIKYLIIEGEDIMATGKTVPKGKGTQEKKAKEYAEDIQRSTDENIFMVTNMTDVSVEEGVNVSIGDEPSSSTKTDKKSSHTGPAFPEEFNDQNGLNEDVILMVTEGRLVDISTGTDEPIKSDKKTKTGELGYNACMTHFGSIMDKVKAAQEEARKTLESKKSA